MKLNRTDVQMTYSFELTLTDQEIIQIGNLLSTMYPTPKRRITADAIDVEGLESPEDWEITLEPEASEWQKFMQENLDPAGWSVVYAILHDIQGARFNFRSDAGLSGD